MKAALCQFILHGMSTTAFSYRDRRRHLGNLRDFLLTAACPIRRRALLRPGQRHPVERGGEIFLVARLQQLGECRGPARAVESLTHHLRYAANLGRSANRRRASICWRRPSARRDAGGYDQGAIVLLLREWANDSLIGSHRSRPSWSRRTSTTCTCRDQRSCREDQVLR
jgi:hypothetical protein